MRGFPQLNANDTANIVFWHFLFRPDTVRILPETPKPLLAVIYGILSDLHLLWFTEILKTAAIAFIPLIFFKILYREFRDKFYSLISVFLVFCLMFVVIKPDVMVPSFLYAMSLLFISLYFFLEGKGAMTALFLMLSGLMRNDFWFFSAVYILYSLLRWKKLGSVSKRTFFLPIFSPLLWILFDWRVGGSFNYSSETVRYVSDILKFTKAPLLFYIAKSGELIWAATFKNPIVLIFGILGFLALFEGRNKLSWFLILFFLFPFLEIFGLYAIEPPPLSARFFFPTFLLLYALSPIGWKSFFEKLKLTKKGYWVSFFAIVVFGASGVYTLKYYDRNYLSSVWLRDYSLYVSSKYVGEHNLDKYEGVITHQGLSFIPVITGDWGAINRTYSLMEVLKGAFDFRKAHYIVLSYPDAPSRKFHMKVSRWLKEIYRTPDGAGRVYLVRKDKENKRKERNISGK